MLTAEPSFERIALNRVTFGAREVDEAYVQAIGWDTYVSEQLNPPPGDDNGLAAHLASQTMKITYRGQQNAQGGWPDVDENRPLNYLAADTETLFKIAIDAGKTVSFAEQARIQQEIAAASWIRAAHAEFQIREFMVDFWHNHFNIGRGDSQFGSATLPVYDREHIRPHALGNFREMLESNATSTAMLLYLDNASSVAKLPNENYGRELLELHTLGEEAYLGYSDPADQGPVGLGSAIGVKSAGFSDLDVIAASQALSGWTVEFGQPNSLGGGRAPITGNFFYNPLQHSSGAQKFMGVSLSGKTEPMAQGQAVLDIAAGHASTAEFVCGKLVRRIFGDKPPEAVHNRAVAAWKQHQDAPDQIKRVMEAILLDGPEVGQNPTAKIRRPFERIIALFRTTDTVVHAHPWMAYLLEPLKDGLFTWPAPNGRPDVNGYWFSTTANLTTWNLCLWLFYLKEISTSFANQTPLDIQDSPTQMVEFWLGRMIGYEPSEQVVNTLIDDAIGPAGIMTGLNWGAAADIESSFARLAALISTTEEFSFR
ncbi:MAG: DUF1800 domain-containing protein [Rhodospirillaceae bacterium]